MIKIEIHDEREIHEQTNWQKIYSANQRLIKKKVIYKEKYRKFLNSPKND